MSTHPPYVEASGELSGLTVGKVPAKTMTGFRSATLDDIEPGTTNKPFVPAAVGAMAGVAISSGSVGGAVVGPPTVVGTGQLTNGVYTVLATDSRLHVTATASVAAEIDLLPGSAGAELMILNAGGTADAARLVTPKATAPDTIQGVAWDANNPPLVLRGRDSVRLVYVVSTARWEVL